MNTDIINNLNFKYYKGEKECPFKSADQDKIMLWFYERYWIEHIKKRKEYSDYSDEDSENITLYMNSGLTDFKATDNNPMDYKAFLFIRYCKDAYSIADSVEPFKAFYEKYY